MHARHRLTVVLLIALATLLAACSKPAPQPTGVYAGPRLAIRFDTTSRLTFVGENGLPDVHCDYTQDGDALNVVSRKDAPQHFEATMRIEDDAKFITITTIKNIDSGQVITEPERLSKVLAAQ